MNRTQTSYSREQGFTLIEVLISIAVLGTTLMSVFTISSQCLVEIRRAKNRSIATGLNQAMLEIITTAPLPCSSFHGLSTAVEPPLDNPARRNLLTWKTGIQAFPTSAVGTITVQEDRYTCIVTVLIDYDDYGKTSRNHLTIIRAQQI